MVSLSVPALPAQGSTEWYAHYQALHDVAAAALPVLRFPDTFADVYLGGQNGTATAQTLSAQSFLTINLPSENSDVSGLFASNLYTVPETGVYEISAKVRPVDGVGGGLNFGVGVHTANIDGPWFQWQIIPTEGTTGQQRYTVLYHRLGRFTAGEQLRLFGWTSNSLALAIAGLTIMRVA